MAINGSKSYEIAGDKYSFAFQDGKLLGVNKVDASGDFVSNAALDSAIFQTDAAKKNIINAYNVDKYGGKTDNYLSTESDKINESFAKLEQSTDKEKSSYFDLQGKKYNNQQYVETDQVDSLAQARPGEEDGDRPTGTDS